MRFLEQQIKKNTCIYLNKLYKEHKNELYLKEAKKYLDCYPNDIEVRYRYAKVFRYIGKTKESIEQLKYILKTKPNEPNALSFLYFTYYHEGNYKDAYNLIPHLLQNCNIDRTAIYLSKLVMKKILNIPFQDKENIDNTYIKRQIVNYNKEYALNHIKKHLEESEDNEENFPKFKDVDLEYLIDVIRKNLNKGIKEKGQDVMDVYYFSVFGIGENESEKCNYIKVVVVPGSDNIINMYPILNPNFRNVVYVDIDYDILFKRENKVKKISRTDKFNKKYNR